MTKKPNRFQHLEFRRFGYKLEIACFNKQGGFKWAFYLPTFRLLTRKAFFLQAMRSGLIEVTDDK